MTDDLLKRNLALENLALEEKSRELTFLLAQLRAVLDATTDGILVTSDSGEVINFNEKFREFWKLSGERVNPLSPEFLQEFMASQCVNPHEFCRRQEIINRSPVAESLDILHLSDGRICESYSRIQQVGGASRVRVWTFRDVTQQRQTEYALREEGRILELLNKAGISIGSQLNLESLLQEITNAATELSGAKFGAFLHNRKDPGTQPPLCSLAGAPREFFQEFSHLRSTALINSTFLGDEPIRSDDVTCDPGYGDWPSHLPLRSYLAVPVVSRSGDVIGGLFFGHPEVGIFTERTERLVLGLAAQAAVAVDNARLYEAAQADAGERARLLESERSARLLAEDQNRSKDAFLAMLGHELRNPLSAISSGVAVIKMAGLSSEKANQAYDVIRRQSAHLGRIVDDLLDTARMLAGKISLKKQSLDLGEAVRNCLSAITLTGRADKHTIKVSLDSVLIDADPARVEQIISNLITNALKYTPAAGEITIRVEANQDAAILKVSDTGMGIPADLLRRIFDPFEQGERTLDRSEGGLGIGLTFVRKLVELHGGSVTITSRGEGLGSTAMVNFPRVLLQQSPAEELEKPSSNEQPKVLLIEDNPDARTMTSAMLQLSEYQVIEAESGNVGLELAARHCPEIAIIDIGLPDLNGYEVARRLRHHASTQGMRLIALTGYTANEDIQRALDAGFDLHMAKPIDFSRLMGALKAI